MRRPIVICAAVGFLLGVAPYAAQAQRGGQGDRQIIVPAPAVTISPPAPTVNVTTPPPTVNVTTPPPVVTITVPNANDPGQAAFGITPGIGSFFGALTGGLLGLLGVGLTAWLGTRNLRRQMEEQAARTREQMHEEATLQREAELRRADGERRAIAAAFLAEVDATLQRLRGAQGSPGDAQDFVLMPNPKIPIFDAYTSRLHVLSFETVYAVTQAYGTLSYLKSLRFQDPHGENLGETLRLHRSQVNDTIGFLERAQALLRVAAGNVDVAGQPAAAAAPAG